MARWGPEGEMKRWLMADLPIGLHRLEWLREGKQRRRNFVLHFESVYGSSEGSPATVWPQAGAVASPHARRGPRFAWDSTKTQAQTRARVLYLRVEISMIKATIYRAAGTST
jgi:hypothetical protein